MLGGSGELKEPAKTFRKKVDTTEIRKTNSETDRQNSVSFKREKQ